MAVATQKIAYGGDTAVAMSTTGPADGASATSSSAILNTGNKYLDVMIGVQVASPSSGTTVPGYLAIYIRPSADESGYSDAANDILIGHLNVWTNSANYAGVFSVAKACDNNMPTSFYVRVQNETGGTVSALTVHYNGCYVTSTVDGGAAPPPPPPPPDPPPPGPPPPSPPPVTGNASPTPLWESFSVGSRYMPATVCMSYGSGTPATAASAYYTYVDVPPNNGPYTVLALALYLYTAQTGAAARMGIYSDWYGYPRDLLADCGAVSLTGAAGFKETTGATLTVGTRTSFWVCTWMANVATQASVAGYFPLAGRMPTHADNITLGATGRGWKYVGAYPASLPAVAQFAPSLILGVDGSNATPLPFLKIQ